MGIFNRIWKTVRQCIGLNTPSSSIDQNTEYHEPIRHFYESRSSSPDSSNISIRSSVSQISDPHARELDELRKECRRPHMREDSMEIHSLWSQDSGYDSAV